MKSRLHKIKIQNFKAFRQFSLKLEGRHLLLYGSNGSGKSSLYWALYTFLQSAGKSPKGVIAKYFEPGGAESLLNIHEQAEENPLAGQISLTLNNSDGTSHTTYHISKDIHATDEEFKGTYREPVIQRGNLASDFITYRFLFGFSHFRNSEQFNLWPLFEREILPFCVSTGGHSPLEEWKRIEYGIPNPHRLKGAPGSDAFDRFEQSTYVFADLLLAIVDSISKEAQTFYDRHFSKGDKSKVELKLKVTQNAECEGKSTKSFKFIKPVISFGVRVGGEEVKRPQSFLNEAKLTQLAISVRFAASMVNLHESDLKLLVLDDLLVSLDMDNRMKVVEILLGSDFENYQKIILTHDRGFFEEFRRMIGSNHTDWCFRSLIGNPKDGIGERVEKSPIQRAADYIHGHDLEAAGVQLRKAAEETAENFRRIAMSKTQAPGEFHSLSENLKAAKNHLIQQLPMTLYNKAMTGIPEGHRDKLVSTTDDDVENDTSLSPAEKGQIKCQRNRLKQFLTHQAWQNFKAIEIVDSIIQMKDRVLNPAAHWNETPLYEAEVKKALKLIERLQAVLSDYNN